MKRAEFNGFYEAVKTAGNNDPVWWAGYLWIDLTEKQSEKIMTALSVNTAVEITLDLRTGVTSYRLPSGMTLRHTDGD